MVKLTKKIKEHERQKNYIILAENAYLSNNKKEAIKFYNKALKFRIDQDNHITILYNMGQIGRAHV